MGQAESGHPFVTGGAHFVPTSEVAGAVFLDVFW